MAATDTFEAFLKQLTAEHEAKLKEYIREQRLQMFAARSEDARMRIVHEIVREAREIVNRK